MKSINLHSLKYIIPSLGLGILFIWLGIKDLTVSQKDEIITSFKQVDFFWIFVSLCIALLSHWSRSVRWQYTLDALDMKTSFWNRYLTLLINYFTNLAIPRAGEITRCALMSKYEKKPFDKILGTLIIERLVDLLVLLLVVLCFFFWQYDKVYDFLVPFLVDKFNFSSAYQLIFPLVLIISCLVLGVVLINKFKPAFILTVKQKLQGLKEGVMSLFMMKQKIPFLLHTLLIWSCYIGMFGVCFKALPSTGEISFATIYAAFIFGTFAMVLTQGGLGAYPLFVMQGLALYGISETVGYSLGWIIWTSQTVMVLITGMLAFLLLPIYNEKRVKEDSE